MHGWRGSRRTRGRKNAASFGAAKTGDAGCLNPNTGHVPRLNPLSSCLPPLPSPACRAAIDRQIDIERKKRLEIDRRKGEELDAERGDIQAWQRQLQEQQQQQLQLQQGNESDYESEEEGTGAPSASRDPSEQLPMPDHEHYYGKGWKPSSSRLAVIQCRYAAGSTLA